MPQVVWFMSLILILYVFSLNNIERAFYENISNFSKLDIINYDFPNRNICEAKDSDNNEYIWSCVDNLFLPQDKLSSKVLTTSCITCKKINVSQSWSISILWGGIVGEIRSIPGYFKPDVLTASGQLYEFEWDLSSWTFFSSWTINQSGRDGIVKNILLDICGDEDICDNNIKPGFENFRLEREGDELFIFNKDVSTILEDLYFRFPSNYSDESESTEIQYLKKG